MSLEGFALLRPVTVTDAMLTADDIAENDYPAWNAATAYALDAQVIRTTTHRIYKRRVAGTTATAPESDPTNWLDMGATNRWKKFDASYGSRSTKLTSMSFTLQAPADVVTGLYLGNVDASQARVVMTDATEGVVYDRTILTAPDMGIQDWYAYFFEPVTRGADLIFDDLPPYLGASIAVTVSDVAGNTVALGVCLLGFLRSWGGARYGTSVGIKDFSRKEPDEFGGYSVVERAFSKRARLPVLLPAALVDALYRQLSEYRATPVLYVGSTLYASTLVYGFFRDFEIVIAYAALSEVSIEVEGLS